MVGQRGEGGLELAEAGLALRMKRVERRSDACLAETVVVLLLGQVGVY